MGKRIPDLTDGLVIQAADEFEISRGANSLRLAASAVRAGLFPSTGGTITGNVVVTGDILANGAGQFDGGLLVTGLFDVNGQLSFVDTGSAGLILNNLTTGQRNALTPVGGELIFNVTDGAMQFYDGSTWASPALGSFVQLAGDTMTGLLSWSGTAHAGLRLNLLTTAQKNALVPGAADLLFDSTLSRPFYWDGFAWQACVKLSGDAMTGALVATEIGHAGGNIVIKPAEVDGSLPFGFNSSVTHTSNYLFTVANNATPKLSIAYDGGLTGAAGATFSGNVQAPSFSHATAMTVSPAIADASTPYLLNTTLAHTSGNLLDVKNNGTSKFSVDYAGGVAAVSAAITNGVSAGSFSSTSDEITLDPSVADTFVAFKFDTKVAHTSGNLLSVGNNGTTKFAIDFSGGLTAAGGNYFFTPDVADGSTPFGLNTSLTHTSGYLFLVANNGTPKLSLAYDGGLVAGNATLAQTAVDNLAITQSALAYAATTTIDLSGIGVRTLTLAGDVTFATSNRSATRAVTVKILGDGSDRTLTFPAWKFLGTAPTTLVAGKTAVLSVTAFGPLESDVVAAYAVEA